MRSSTTSQKTVIFRLPNIIHFEDDSFLRCISMRLHSPTSQKNVIFILTTMRNWYLKFYNSSNTSSYLYTHPGATNWSDWHQTASGTHDAAVSCLPADKYRGCAGGRQSKKYGVTKKNPCLWDEVLMAVKMMLWAVTSWQCHNSEEHYLSRTASKFHSIIWILEISINTYWPTYIPTYTNLNSITTTDKTDRRNCYCIIILKITNR
jgi:hypothetical protein